MCNAMLVHSASSNIGNAYLQTRTGTEGRSFLWISQSIVNFLFDIEMSQTYKRDN